MRLIKKTINEQDGSGTATLLPEEPEDMWHLYNLIRPNDIVRAPAKVKVRLAGEKHDSTGLGLRDRVKSTIMSTTITIRVTKTDFDAGASELHVLGVSVVENKHVPLGQHHTLDLETNRQFSLSKGGDDGWDSVALMQLRQATDMRKRAEVYAVVMQEGLANICVITEHQTLLRQRVEASIPRKRAGHGSDAHEKGVEKFFATTLATLLRHLDPSTLATDTKSPPLLLASPGFTAAGFHKFIMATATRNNDKPLLTYARDSAIIAHTSSGHLHALSEVLKSPAVQARLSDTRYARETALMDRFFDLLRADEGRAWYGPREVERAVEKGAVGRGGGVLLISNALFRAQDVLERKRWVALVEKVREVEGGEVRVLSSSHDSGKRLEGLGSVGAILTFPLLDLDEEEEGGDGVVVDEEGTVVGGRVQEPRRRPEEDEEIEI